ncbi:hypothetical protein FACS189426_06290 [Bacteroidia bacterium]|nr:hypothetical protein FACS189426_06290 [Bacteroidia bacterium]GHV71215.1 hypothetical protein FACS189420_5480 [Bacteroidia bacterium]
MTKEELAALLDGREHRDEIFKDEEKAAKESGLVVVFGASDDLMELRGAIRDEIGCYEGGTACFDENGLLENECENEDCPHFEKIKEKAKKIEALWCAKEVTEDNYISWTYETDIPHSTFKIMEDEEIYCIGIVFSIYDLKK